MTRRCDLRRFDACDPSRPALEGSVVATWDATGSSVACWTITRGTIGHVELPGLCVLTVACRPAASPAVAPGRLVVLDEHCSPEQVWSLVDAFEGRHRSIPVRSPHATWVFCSPGIACSFDGPEITVRAADRVTLHLVVPDPPHEAIAQRDLDLIPTVPFRTVRWATPGSEASVDIPEFGLVWHGGDLPSIAAGFAWRPDPTR